MGKKIADEIHLFICRIGFALNIVCLADAINEVDVMLIIMHFLFIVIAYIDERLIIKEEKNN